MCLLTSQRRLVVLSAAVAAVVAGFVSQPAQAATKTWAGTNASTDWNTGANWGGTIPATSGAALVFSSSSPTSGFSLTNTLPTTDSFAGITFNAGSYSYTMGGNTFALSVGITNNSSGLQTFNNGSAMNATSGSGGLSLSLTSATFTVSSAGGVTITNGLISTAPTDQMLTVNGVNGTLILGGYDLANTLSARTSVISGTGNVTITGPVKASMAPTSGLTYKGSGVLTLQGENTYSGATLMSGGTVKIDNLNALPSASAVTISTGGTLDVNGKSITNAISMPTNSSTLVNNSTTPATLVGTITHYNSAIGGTGDIELDSVSSSFQPLRKVGTNTLTLGGSTANATRLTVTSGKVVLGKTAAVNAVDGAIILNGGMLQLAGSGGDQIADAASVTMAAGTTFDLNDRSETIASLSGPSGTVVTNSGTGASALTLAADSNFSFGGVLQDGSNGGTLAISQTAKGKTLTLSGNNSHSGGTTMQYAGTLKIGSNTALGTGSITLSASPTYVSANIVESDGGTPYTLNNNVSFATYAAGTQTVQFGNTGFLGNLSFGTGTLSTTGSLGSVSVANGSTTFANFSTSGPTNLIKVGSGALIFTGNFTNNKTRPSE